MSTLQVQTLQGPTSGADSNTIRVADNHKLHAKGHVVQCVHHQWNTVTTNTTSSFIPAQSSKLSFTPKFADSLLVITYDFNLAVEYISGATQSGGAGAIYHDGVSIQAVPEAFELYSNATDVTNIGAALFARQTKINSVSAGSTSARDIELYFRPYLATVNNATVNRNGNYSNLLVQEIAQ